MGTIRLAHPITKDSIVDGPGLRTVIWVQGCYHHCFMCHNPQTHCFSGGFEKDIDELISEIVAVKCQAGITISGGEPFEKIDELCELLDKLAPYQFNVWCYSGYTYEYLKNHPHKSRLLNKIDVIVDGKFEWELRNFNLKYRGSSNQKIIDCRTGRELLLDE